MKASRIFLASFGFLLGCTQTGVQGTSLYSSFSGIEQVQVLSPHSVSLSWGLDQQYSKYNIYMNGGSSPTRWETFSRTVIKELEPSTTYSFKVTGIERSSSSENDVGATLSATTWASFTGLVAGGVTLKSPTEVTLTWDMNSPEVTYKLFSKKQGETWNLNQPTAIAAAGMNQHTITGLTAGQIYCFYIQAFYKDDTFEPISTTQVAVDAVAPCKQMTSSIPNLPTIMVNSSAPGPFPWFWTANGDPTYRTEVYERDTNNRVASIVGNGPFHAFAKTEEGTKTYYAIVSKGNEVDVRPVEPSGHTPKTSTKIRTLNAAGNRGPLFPSLMNGGHGRQNFGTNITTGDFNCDGLPDVAVSMPTAVIVPSVNHYTETGAVAVYYSYRPTGPCRDADGDIGPCPTELKTDVAPAISNVFPNPMLITYPATSDQMRHGLRMTTGNFNGDCYERDAANLRGGNCNSLFATEANPLLIKSIKTCDDLVISVSNNSFYVIYGDPNQGLVTGSGASTAGENEFTCDTFSNSCRVVRMTAPTTPLRYGNGSSEFALALTAGDFNNDGFDELAVSAPIASTPWGNGYRNVLIYRGSAQGLYPFGASGNHASVDVTDSSLATGLTNLGALTSNDEFGSSIATAYDSRRCVNGVPAAAVYRSTQPAQRKGYDFTKCDDLVIGSPGRASNRGAIFSCKGVQANATDKQKITSWNCQEHFPTNLTGKVARYGAAVGGAKNFNGYPINNIKSNPNNVSLEVPDIAGAVFVGAPRETIDVGPSSYTDAGAVYGYYLTPLSADNSSGGIQGILGSSSLGHAVESINDVACDKLNANKTTGSLKHCNNQKLTMTPLESGARFGSNLGILPRTSGPDLDEESMKMLAIAAPSRAVSSSDGTGTVYGAGSVFLYRADVSTFGAEGIAPILSPQRSVGQENNYSCTLNCTWYSGGVSPYGTSIFYPRGLTTNANFGMGGIVGGSFNGDTEGDLMTTAPNLDYPTPQNGAAFIFESRSGFAPTENVPARSLYAPLGLEGGYHFEEAKVLGDVNGDGYEDIATHINANGTWRVVVYYGSPNGIIKTPTPSSLATGVQPLLLSQKEDRLFGLQFYPAGDVNGDGFKDLLVIGSVGSYLFYGSLNGLVSSQEPVIAPIGKGPLLFARSGNWALMFGDEWTDVGRPISASYNEQMQGVTVADLNNDDIDDLVIRLRSNGNPGSTSMGGLSFLSNQSGRVVVIYGSATGPQVNRNTGRITLKDDSGALVDAVVEDPCTATKPSVCKVQYLGVPNTAATDGYGFAVTTVRRSRDGSPFKPQNDRLLVGDYSTVGASTTSDGAIYVFEGSLTGLKTNVIQTLVPRPGKTNQRFGWQMANVGDLNGDDYEDIVISSGHSLTPELYVFYGQIVGGVVGYYGATALGNTDYWTTTVLNNDQHASQATPVPQVIRPSSVLSGDLISWGVTAVGDFNNDGYNDVAVNVPNGDSTISGTIEGTGYVIIFFGSRLGLQVKNLVVTPYPRCYGGATPVCDPMQVFLPDAVEYENTSINPYSAGDLNGDGYKDLVIGGVGRDLLSNGISATSTGVIFVLY